MKKNLLTPLIILLLLIIYLMIGYIFHIYLNCPIHEITGLYCPGCGLTRMLYALIGLDVYQAFRYNPVLFIMLPFIIFLYIEDLYCRIKNKKSIYKKVPDKVWYIILILLLIYGILRNIIPWLAPTVI